LGQSKRRPTFPDSLWSFALILYTVNCKMNGSSRGSKDDFCSCSLSNTESSSPGTGSRKVGKAHATHRHIFPVSIVILNSSLVDGRDIELANLILNHYAGVLNKEKSCFSCQFALFNLLLCFG
jgi:hypothetical protein